jgi:two-component system, NarL family, response regulator DevR
MTAATAPQDGDGMSLSGQTEGPPWHHSQSIQPDLTVCEAGAAASPVKVLIVEDSLIVRKRLAALMAGLSNVTIVGQAEDGFQAQALFRQHRPDAVVLDIQVPGINGLDLLAQFKREHPTSVVMVLTTYAFKEFRQRCVALGADYFFDKCAEFERVIEVLGTFPPRHDLKNGNRAPAGTHDIIL